MQERSTGSLDADLTATNGSEIQGVSRRTWLGGAALALGAGVGAMLPGRASAQQKMKQADAKYQESAKDGHQCDGCAQFMAPNACKLVDGTISPNGWCQLWTPKG